MPIVQEKQTGAADRTPEAGNETHPETTEGYLEAGAVAPYGGETYYDIPPVRHSHYKWPTSLAFFFNGLAGGIQILSNLADLFGGRKARPLVRIGRYLALAGGTSSPLLLISELHTRKRWYNMLRLFKRTSPMSIGIWSIAPFGILSGLSAVGQFAEDLGYERAGRGIGRTFGIPAAVCGSVMMTYMGSEQEETNMPLWASAYPLMAPLYAAVGISGAAAALTIAAEAAGADESVKLRLNNLSLLSGSAELVIGTLVSQRWEHLPETRSYRPSAYSPLFRHGYLKAGVIYPLILNVLYTFPYGRSPARAIPAAVAKLAGTLLLQFVMIYAGSRSGDHARDYFEFTRAPELAGPHSGETPAPTSAGEPAEPAAGEDPLPRRPSALPWLIGIGAAAGTAAWVLSRKKGK